MKISVAIASYNGERFIKKQLISIHNQSYTVDEVIICDDASTDNTAQICRDFINENSLINWKVFDNSENSGYCLNFYNAIKKCSGDVIFLADQDDEWYENKVETMVDCLNNHPEITVLSSRYDLIDENSNKINLKIPYLDSNFAHSIEFLPLNSFIGCSYIRGFSMCFKKDIKPFIKSIDLKSLLSHDWYLCMLGNVSGKVAVLNTKLCAYRYHGANTSLSAIGNREKRIKGLYESVEGHKYIASLLKEGESYTEILSFCDFEIKRLKFLKNKNLFLWLKLLLNLKQYNRYYKGNGIRVWLGDFLYAFNFNFKKRKKY